MAAPKVAISQTQYSLKRSGLACSGGFGKELLLGMGLWFQHYLFNHVMPRYFVQINLWLQVTSNNTHHENIITFAAAARL